MWCVARRVGLRLFHRVDGQSPLAGFARGRDDHVLIAAAAREFEFVADARGLELNSVLALEILLGKVEAGRGRNRGVLLPDGGEFARLEIGGEGRDNPRDLHRIGPRDGRQKRRLREVFRVTPIGIARQVFFEPRADKSRGGRGVRRIVVGAPLSHQHREPQPLSGLSVTREDQRHALVAGGGHVCGVSDDVVAVRRVGLQAVRLSVRVCQWLEDAAHTRVGGNRGLDEEDVVRIRLANGQRHALVHGPKLRALEFL